jgi:nucleotide-binding universal stress UspA family protein
LADIIVASSHKGSDLSESDVGDLAMISGRPVLVPADGAATFSAKSVVVAWKNTREARRAIGDALPILGMAETVRILAIVGKDRGEGALDGVIEYLARHGVKAEPMLISRDHAPPGEALIREAKSVVADLIVAGAYGHSRFRELAFGGITRDLLHQSDLSVMLSN